MPLSRFLILRENHQRYAAIPCPKPHSSSQQLFLATQPHPPIRPRRLHRRQLVALSRNSRLRRRSTETLAESPGHLSAHLSRLPFPVDRAERSGRREMAEEKA